MFSAMEYRRPVLRLIDQRLLPNEQSWIEAKSLEMVAVAIENMAVRGAPAIGCAAAYALAIDARMALHSHPYAVWETYQNQFLAGVERLARTRPTAVNLFYALDAMRHAAADLCSKDTLATVADRFELCAQTLFDDDLATCKTMAHYGADLAQNRPIRVLTHCNTGSLATAGYGTALGVIRALHERALIKMVYADETRPWLQGARLTAFELKSEGIPYRLIADSASGYLMQKGEVDLIVVGADRIAANGDTANKIGTYGLAVNAHFHEVPFYVVAPLSTVDLTKTSGVQIAVEERHPDELRHCAGHLIAPSDAGVWNPAFDVTPWSLITGIITEFGVLRPPFSRSLNEAFTRQRIKNA